MREHPAITHSILSRVKQFHELAFVAGAHHEKLDGSGYPNALEADDLPLEARILTVSDVYSALIENRPYRAGFSPERALEIIKREAPGKLDPDCLDALASVAFSSPYQAPLLTELTPAHPQPSQAQLTAGKLEPARSTFMVQ
jgi:HD-GYP domain-containing protein (c-di-GMP phosphodiesterase class II)